MTSLKSYYDYYRQRTIIGFNDMKVLQPIILQDVKGYVFLLVRGATEWNVFYFNPRPNSTIV